MSRKTLDLCNMSPDDTKLFNLYFEYNRKKYTEWIDAISCKWGEDIYWWATYFASRDILGSNTLQNICKVLLCINYIEKDDSIDCVKVDSHSVAKTLKLYYRSSKRKIIFIEENSNRMAFERERRIVSFFIYLFKEIRKFLVVRKTCLSERKSIAEEIVLIETDVFSSCFKTGEYCARDFANIMDFTKENVRFLPYMFINSKMSLEELIRYMRESKKYKFLFREDYLRFIDYLRTIRYPFECIRFENKKYFWDDIDVSSIVREDITKGINSLNSLYAMLNYSLMKRLHIKKMNVKKLIGWYEGQPSSLGIFKGFREFYEQEECVGYIGIPIDDNYLSISPSKGQVQYQAVPQYMSVIGESFINVPKQFNEKTDVFLAPTFRLKKVNCAVPENKKFSILVALPYAEEDAQYVLNLLYNTKNLLHNENVNIYIKNHPTKAEWKLENYGLDAGGVGCEFLTGDFASALEKVHLVITCTSSTTYETVIAGRQLIIIALPSRILLTYLPKDQAGYDVVYSSNELEASITNCMHTKEGFRHGKANMIMPTAETVRRLLDRRDNRNELL